MKALQQDSALHRSVRQAVQILLAVALALPAAAAAQELYGAPAAPTGPSQDGSIHGRVRTAAGIPLAGVRVRLDPLARADTSDAAGRFDFDRVPRGAYALTFSRDSVATRRVNVRVADRPETLTIVLGPPNATSASAAEELDPVVVTARASAPPPAIGKLPDVRGTEIFAGKKTESVQVDSLSIEHVPGCSRASSSPAFPVRTSPRPRTAAFPRTALAFAGSIPCNPWR